MNPGQGHRDAPSDVEPKTALASNHKKIRKLRVYRVCGALWEAGQPGAAAGCPDACAVQAPRPRLCIAANPPSRAALSWW